MSSISPTTGETRERPSTRIGPQPGPQTIFLATPADIAIYGGSAGGGKTYALLLDKIRNIQNPDYGAVIFRRTMKQVKDEGGIWDESAKLYTLAGAKPNITERYWTFPDGSVVQFAGLENELDKLNWQGAQICDLDFDELLHFLESQFWYLLSRNRSTCGLRPKCRATCNPGPGWVKRLLAPWVDSKYEGQRAKSGDVLWFIRENDKTIYVPKPPTRTPCGCLKEGCESCFPPEKSITFVRASVYDNRILLSKNPEYIANLKALPELEKRQLLYGDWDAKPANRVLSAFDESRNVISGFEKYPRHWKRHVGLDFGPINTAEVIIVEDPEHPVRVGNNEYTRLIVSAVDWPGVARSDKTIADTIREMANGTPYSGAGGNRTGEQGWRQSFRKEEIPLDEPIKEHANPGLQFKNVNEGFREGWLVVDERCTEIIDMINRFEHIKDAKTGEVTDEFDDSTFHLLSALRYIVTKLRPPKRRSLPQTGATTVTKAAPTGNSAEALKEPGRMDSEGRFIPPPRKR